MDDSLLKNYRIYFIEAMEILWIQQDESMTKWKTEHTAGRHDAGLTLAHRRRNPGGDRWYGIEGSTL
jgi:hypothetical protein